MSLKGWEKVDAITEKTLVPLSLVVILVGGILWLARIESLATANAAAVRQLSKDQQEYNRTVIEINTRLSRIEGKLEGR